MSLFLPIKSKAKRRHFVNFLCFDFVSLFFATKPNEEKMLKWWIFAFDFIGKNNDINSNAQKSCSCMISSFTFFTHAAYYIVRANEILYEHPINVYFIRNTAASHSHAHTNLPIYQHPINVHFIPNIARAHKSPIFRLFRTRTQIICLALPIESGERHALQLWIPLTHWNTTVPFRVGAKHNAFFLCNLCSGKLFVRKKNKQRKNADNSFSVEWDNRWIIWVRPAKNM